MKQIIGLVGLSVSGKGTVSKLLEKEFGFFATSLSDRIREELDRREIVETRDWMRKVGNELREKYGADILVKRTEEMISDRHLQKVVIDSVRNPTEVEEIRRMGGIILGVEASAEKRFELMKMRGRNGDALTWEEFLRLDEEEERAEDFGQQNSKCLEMADKTIKNDGTGEDLKEKIRQLIPSLKFSEDKD
jgi:dephospho-CoA kinase